MGRSWIVLGLVLGACAQFPEVDEALATDGAPVTEPELLPFEQLVVEQDPEIEDEDDETLLRRADELRQRTDNLRPPVIDNQTLDRMNAGVTNP